MAVSHVYSNAVPDATGTMTVWFGATTATVAASDVVKPSDWNSAHNQVVTITGNTVGVAQITGTNIVFGGSNNVTLSGVQGVNAGTIHISAAAGGGGGSVNLSAGTTSNNLTNFVFADSNGVSFGLNGSTVTATVRTDYQSAGAYLTTARASNDAIGLATAQSNVTWTANSAGLSLDARGYAGTATGATNASVTVNSNGVSVSVGNYLTSQSNQAFSAAGGSSAFQTLGFSDTNGVSFSNSNGSVVATVRTDYASSVHGHTATLFATSNTTQSSTGTANLNSLIFAGAGIASVGVTNGSVVVSVPSGGGAGDGGVFAGVSNLGNTAGSTGTVSTGNFVLVGSNGITLSQSTGGAGSEATITILPPTQATLSQWWNHSGGTIVGAQSSFHQQTSQFIPLLIQQNVTASVVRIAMSFSDVSSNFATTANATGSQGATSTSRLVLYTQGTGASSSVLQSVWSTSVSFAHKFSYSANANGSQYTISTSNTFHLYGGSTTSTFTTAISSASLQYRAADNLAAGWSGAVRLVDIPFGAAGSSLSPGVYVLAINASSQSTSDGTFAANMTSAFPRASLYVSSNLNQAYGRLGAYPGNTNRAYPFYGIASTTNSGTTASVEVTKITSLPTMGWPLIQLISGDM